MTAELDLCKELNQKHYQLRSFRSSLGQSLQQELDRCEWGMISGGGQGGLPLITLRLPHRIFLGDPFLLTLAEEAEGVWGPVDFALFSGETSEPLRVLSKTLLDHRWRWG